MIHYQSIEFWQESLPRESILSKTRGHSDVVFSPIFSSKYQKVPPVRQLTFCAFDMKSNDFGPVIPESLKIFKN